MNNDDYVTLTHEDVAAWAEVEVRATVTIYARAVHEEVARIFAQAKRRVRTRYERDLREHRRRNPPELSQVERDARKQIGDAMMRDFERSLFAKSGRIPILVDVVHGNPSDASGRARLTRQIPPRVL